MRKELFRVRKINSRLIRITDVADTHMYLVLGDNKAALLDTGVGVGDLRALVEKLTDKPVTVLITHGHIDHAMGAGQFEKAHMNPKDHDLFIEHSDPDMRIRNIHGELFGPKNPETAFVMAEMLSVISSIYLFAIVMGLITALPVYADNTYVQTSSDEYEAPLIIT